MAKSYILENGFEQDIPEDFKKWLERNKIEAEFKDSRFLFWEENRDETIKWFKSLANGTKFYASTVFNGFGQLELFVAMLVGESPYNELEFYLSHPCLCDALAKYLLQHESDIVPDTEEYNDSPDLRMEFKATMNRRLLKAMEIHKIVWLTRDPDMVKNGGRLEDMFDILRGIYDDSTRNRFKQYMDSYIHK